jgi:hypothetical protein
MTSAELLCLLLEGLYFLLSGIMKGARIVIKVWTGNDELWFDRILNKYIAELFNCPCIVCIKMTNFKLT